MEWATLAVVVWFVFAMRTEAGSEAKRTDPIAGHPGCCPECGHNACKVNLPCAKHWPEAPHEPMRPEGVYR